MQIYQLDNDRTWLGDGPREVHSKGHLQVRAAPPEVPTGHAARWVTDLCSVVDTPTFGDEGTGSWELIEDHRKAKLYTADGEYKIGDDYEGQIYNGLGSIPAWLSTEAPELPEPEPYVPQQVTRAQGKAALIQAGLWSDVLAFVDAIEDPTEKSLAEVALNDTTHWQRTSPFLSAAADALGLTGQQLDDLFKAASQIEL